MGNIYLKNVLQTLSMVLAAVPVPFTLIFYPSLYIIQVIPNASRMWKFQRYKLILEYSNQRPVLFPPFNIFEHLCKVLYMCVQKCCGERCCEGNPDYQCMSKPDSSSPHRSRFNLSLRHKKKVLDKKDEEKGMQLVQALERKSFNKVSFIIMLFGPYD